MLKGTTLGSAVGTVWKRKTQHVLLLPAGLCLCACLLLWLVSAGAATAFWLLMCSALLCSFAAYVILMEVRTTTEAAKPVVDADDVDVHTNTLLVKKKLWVFYCSLGLLCLLGCMPSFAFMVAAGAVSKNYVADHVFSALFAAAVSVLSVLALLAFFSSPLVNNLPRTQRSKPCCSCCFCTCICGLPFIVFLAFLSLWHTSSKANGLLVSNLPLGNFHETTDGPPMHIWCDKEGKNKSAPTVLFLHGFLGGCLDPTWVRRDPAFIATGLQFCSIDRPGYGYGQGYDSGDNVRHFGRVAKLTQEVLHKEKVTGKLILLFHSLGGYHALALANQLEKDEDITIVAGVAIDAMTPRWRKWNISRKPEECNTDVALAPANFFWGIVQRLEPAGLPRFIFATGFQGYDILVRMLPNDIGPRYLSNDMLPKYFQAVVDETQRWARNCGYARAGEKAMGKLLRLDVIVVPLGLNLTQYAKLNNNSHVVLLDGPVGDHHSGVLLDEFWGRKITQVLLDNIKEVR